MSISNILIGGIIVVLGGGFLAQSLGVASFDLIKLISQYWPILLIILGLGLIIRPRKKQRGHSFWYFLILIIIMLVGVTLWPRNYEINKSTINEPIPASANKAEISVKAGSANLSLLGNSEELISGEISSVTLPSITSRVEGETVFYTLETDPGQFINLGYHRNNDYALKLNNYLPMSIKVDTGASKINLNLEDVTVSELTLRCGATAGEIKLGEKASYTKIIIVSGASDIKISVGKNQGLKIVSKSGASSDNFSKIDLIKKDDIYESDNYSSAFSRVEIISNTGASNIVITRR